MHDPKTVVPSFEIASLATLQSDDELKKLNEVSAKFPVYPGWMPDMQRGQDFGAALDHSKTLVS